MYSLPKCTCKCTTFTEVEKHERTRIKPPVPKNNVFDQPMHGIRTTKNFVKHNAAEAELSVPKAPARRLVDDRHGNGFNLRPSGLEPLYLKKKVGC